MKSLYEQFEKPDYLFDSHCHLNALEYDQDRAEVVERAVTSEVARIFDIAVNLETSEKSIEISKNFTQVKSFVGIDPDVFIPGSQFFIGLEQSELWFEESFSKLSDLITKNPELVAGIGETGIDNYYLSRNEIDEDIKTKSLEMQEKLYRMHLELAKKFYLPLSIHSRFAEDKCLEIINEYDVSGIFHSYTGGKKTLKKILDSGHAVGVNGIVTYPNASQVRDIYKSVIDKLDGDITPDTFYKKGIFFETDAPFLSPDGKRGERNEPSNIKLIFESFSKFIKS